MGSFTIDSNNPLSCDAYNLHVNFTLEKGKG
jgi:hypothetical protein